MIRKTIKEYKKPMKSYDTNFGNNTAEHWVRILKSTYWFLFIPLYSTEKLITTTLI